MGVSGPGIVSCIHHVGILLLGRWLALFEGVHGICADQVGEFFRVTIEDFLREHVFEVLNLPHIHPGENQNEVHSQPRILPGP